MSRAKIVITYVIAVGGAVTAVLASLPYGWAKVGAAAVGAGIAALSGGLGTVATVQARQAKPATARDAAL